MLRAVLLLCGGGGGVAGGEGSLGVCTCTSDKTVKEIGEGGGCQADVADLVEEVGGMVEGIRS